MANDREENQDSKDKEQDALKDLDVREEEVDRVKGGRMRSDPCDGGEVIPPPPQ